MFCIEQIKVKNFLSFGSDIQTFTFADKGMHWIDGINVDESDSSGKRSVGSGKSTFTMIVEYALYGDVHKINKNIKRDRLINRNYKCDLYVALIFSIDRERYQIERYRKHHEFGDDVIFSVEVEGEWVSKSKDDRDATQELINQIILINQTTFRKSILLTRDDRAQFLELTTADRGKIFENVIQLNKLKPLYDKIKKERSRLAKESESCDVQLRALKAEAIKYKKHIETNKKEREENIARIEKDIEQLKKENQLLSKYNPDTLLKNIKKWIECNESADELQRNISSLDKKIDSAGKRIKDLNKRKEDAIPTTCHKCGAIQNEEEFNKKIDDITHDIKWVETERQSEIEKHAQLTERHMDMVNIIDTLLDKEIVEYLEDKEIEEVEKYILDYDTQLLGFSEQLKEWQNANTKMFEEYIEKNLKDYRTISGQKKTIDYELGAYDFWNNMLDVKNENSIKQHLISKLIPVFNNVLQRNLDYIYDGTMTVFFDSMFNEKILFKGQETEYIELSTGERLKMNIAVNFSIFDLTRINLAGSSVIFLDEIFTNVDLPTLKKFIDMVRDKYAKESAVYLISHQSEIEDFAQPETKTLIRKENDDSSIEK